MIRGSTKRQAWDRVARDFGHIAPLGWFAREHVRWQLSGGFRFLDFWADYDEPRVVAALDALEAGLPVPPETVESLWRYLLRLCLEDLEFDLAVLHALLAALAPAAAQSYFVDDNVVDHHREQRVVIGPWHAPAPPARAVPARDAGSTIAA